MRHRFRRGFAQFFFWCPWVRVTAEPSLSRSEAVTSRYSCTGSPDMNTRISRNGTCNFSDTCTTGSTTPRSESESRLEDTDLNKGDARTSSIDLRHLVPDVLADVDRGNVITARNCTSHWFHREIPSKAHILISLFLVNPSLEHPSRFSFGRYQWYPKILTRDPSPFRDAH